MSYFTKDILSKHFEKVKLEGTVPFLEQNLQDCSTCTVFGWVIDILNKFVEQASWAELARQGGLSEQKIKNTFVMVEKLSF